MQGQLTRNEFLRLAGAALALPALLPQAAFTLEETPKPNIVLLIVDTLRADVLGSYGGQRNATPELDALAADSVQFDHANSSSSWTLPASGALLTSQHPRSLGLYWATHYLQDFYPTLAQVLQVYGYRTYGATANAVINSVAGFARGFDEYIDTDVNWELAGPRTKRSDEIFKEGLTLAAKKDAAPGYLQLNIMEVHEYYRGDGALTRPEFLEEFPDVPTLAQERQYFQALRQVSVDTAKFIADLRALPQWQNTLFVLLGDHGEGLANHPNVWNSKRHSTLLYESMIRVPLLFHHPEAGLTAKRVSDPVHLLDVMPTILDYVGLPEPAPLQGYSLLDKIRGGKPNLSRPEYLVAETHIYSPRVEKSAVYSAEWKFIENHDLQAGCNEYELQRMGVKENGKKTDEIGSHPEVAKTMREFLDAWQKNYPKVDPVFVRDIAGTSDREQELEALGYF